MNLIIIYPPQPAHTVHQQRQTMMLRPMSRQDIFYTGSIVGLNEYKSQLSMLSYRWAIDNLI